MPKEHRAHYVRSRERREKQDKKSIEHGAWSMEWIEDFRLEIVDLGLRI